MTSVTPAQLSAVRGGMLGLVLGDAIGSIGQVPARGSLSPTCAGQLACFTVDGIIRAGVRYSHKGICHPPGVVWHAYARWAAGRGIADVRPWREHAWPDGWLPGVAALREGRGSAPATVAALRGQTMGTLSEPAGTSVGAHALTRSLPAGLAVWWLTEPISFVRQIAATTHAVEAADVAALGAAVLAKLAQGHRIDRAVHLAQDECAPHLAQPDPSVLASALAAAESDPRDSALLRRLAPDARARSTLAGSVYVAASFPEPAQVRDALLFAAGAGDGGHVATATGAFLGAGTGVAALPVDLVSRLELAWVADVLARDLVSEFVDGPSGTEYTPASDPTWWDRYPGW